jgi:hypothetical protein
MAKYLHPDVLDNGLQHIIDQAAGDVNILLIDTYSAGQAYSTVISNAVMSIDLAPGDLTLSDYGAGRKLTVAEKSGLASGNAAPINLHVAIVDVTRSKVLAVTDETGEANVSIGDPKTIPTFDIRINQPV